MRKLTTILIAVLFLGFAGAALYLVFGEPRATAAASRPAEENGPATRRKVDRICTAIQGWKTEFGAAPAVGVTLSELIRRRPKTDDFRYRDGYGRPFKLVDEGGVLVGAYSFGANGGDEDGGGDDVACRVP